MRLFLAVNLPANVRRELLSATASLRDSAPHLGWMDDARLHLTLKFLGEQPEHAVERLARSVDLVAYGHRAFPMRLGGVGAFPAFRRARVVWMGVAPEPRVELLHHDIEVACGDLGFEMEGRPFRPHITLARVSDTARDEDAMRRLAREAKRVRFDATVEVTSVDVMRSALAAGETLASGGRGARYECLHSAALRAN